MGRGSGLNRSPNQTLRRHEDPGIHLSRSPVYNNFPERKHPRHISPKGSNVIVLVIGGAGYIGSHAARALKRSGHTPLIYDNLSTGYEFLARGFELIKGDILDQSRLAVALQRV